MSTNDYYNKNAKIYIENTLDIDMSTFYSKFEAHLAPGDKVLDLGCGPGRDLKYFMTKYDAQGLEPSLELCRFAREYTGADIINDGFLEAQLTDKYKGIWACASLLHIPSRELAKVFKKLSECLDDNGVIYCSFKHGSFEGDKDGRYFTYLDEKRLASLVNGSDLVLSETWLTNDMRPGRESEVWMNAILSV